MKKQLKKKKKKKLRNNKSYKFNFSKWENLLCGL